jgi:GNAT superfamily N-acetyltransferase
MTKTPPDRISIAVTSTPAALDLAFIQERLSQFNDSDVGPSNRQSLAVVVRDSATNIVAGISGYTAWGWLYVQWLWVDESRRGQRLANTMLTAAEEEAARRGCHGAFIDTFNPRAAKSYTRQGYQPFGVLHDFPVGRSRIFLKKSLAKLG